MDAYIHSMLLAKVRSSLGVLNPANGQSPNWYKAILIAYGLFIYARFDGR